MLSAFLTCHQLDDIVFKKTIEFRYWLRRYR